jgi:hypothetical protein
MSVYLILFYATCITTFPTGLTSNLKLEAMQTMVPTYQSIVQCHYPEDHNMNYHNLLSINLNSTTLFL